MDFDYLMAHPWWQRVTTNVGHCLRQFPAALLVSRRSFPCRTHHILQFSILSRKTTQKTLTCLKNKNKNKKNLFRDYSSKPVLSTSSKPVDIRPPTQDGKQTSQESASTSERPRSNQAPVIKMLTAMEGPKLEVAECSAVIRQARTEFFSRCKRLNMNYVSAGLFFFLNSLSVCVASCLVVCSLFSFSFKTLRLLYVSFNLDPWLESALGSGGKYEGLLVDAFP